MNAADIVILAIVVLLVAFAVWQIRRGKGGCSCGSCAGCQQLCNKKKR